MNIKEEKAESTNGSHKHARILWLAHLDPRSSTASSAIERVLHRDVCGGAAILMPRLIREIMARHAPRSLVQIIPHSYDGFEDIFLLILTDESEALLLAAAIYEAVAQVAEPDQPYSYFEIEASICHDPMETPIGEAKISGIYHGDYTRGRREESDGEHSDDVLELTESLPC